MYTSYSYQPRKTNQKLMKQTTQPNMKITSRPEKNMTYVINRLPISSSNNAPLT